MKQRKRLAYQLTFRYALLIIVAFALMRMMIDALQDYTVAAEAENDRRALELFQEKHPDIILTDIEMPVMNGLELIEAVKAERPETPIIILRSRAEIIHTLCLSESAIAALSSVNVPRHASLLRLALTNSSFAFCMNNFCTAPELL